MPDFAGGEGALFRAFAGALPGLGEQEWRSAWEGLSPEAREALVEHFTIRNRPLGRRLAYRLVITALGLLPFGMRRKVIESMKAVRAGVFRTPAKSVRLPRYTEGEAHLLLRALASRIDPSRARIVVTYDVDQPACVESLPECVRALDGHGLVAAFNFLVHGDYSFPSGLVMEMGCSRHELGLHGYTHDIDFGNRAYSTIADRLERCRRALPYVPQGFRSPALSVSPGLFRALDGAGFAYDSSIPVAHPFHRSCGFPYPYAVAGTGLVELPVLLQDNLFFSDNAYDDAHAFDVTREMIGECTALGGVAVLNLHMYIQVRHEAYHRMLLGWLAEQDVPVVLPRQVAGEYAPIVSPKGGESSMARAGGAERCE